MKLPNMCMYENFRGTAEDMAAMKARCNCKKCVSRTLNNTFLINTPQEEKSKMERICSECEEQAITLINGVCNTCTSKKDDNDIVDYPKHYNTGKIQPIDVIESWQLDFRLANVVKYIARFKHKGSPEKDLEKALWYLQRYIDKELKKK